MEEILQVIQVFLLCLQSDPSKNCHKFSSLLRNVQSHPKFSEGNMHVFNLKLTLHNLAYKKECMLIYCVMVHVIHVCIYQL